MLGPSFPWLSCAGMCWLVLAVYCAVAGLWSVGPRCTLNGRDDSGLGPRATRGRRTGHPLTNLWSPRAGRLEGAPHSGPYLDWGASICIRVIRRHPRVNATLRHAT